jgi:asparagine synthase (glutamine-hydrolysing)
VICQSKSLTQMFYLSYEKKNPLINICNIMTLRYDPTQRGILSLKSMGNDVVKNRKKPYPTSRDVEANIRNVVRRTIAKYKPEGISVALSSGVDSNVILSLIRDEFPKLEINCVTVSFDESTEAHAAKKIAENNSSNFHNVVVENPLRELPYLISLVKEPRWNIYQYYFIEKSSHFSKVLFTGDGGDELFGGYIFRYEKFLASYSVNLTWQDRTRHYLECHERDWVPDQDEIFGVRLHFDWDSIYSLLRPYFDNDLDPLDQVFMADYHGKLMYDFVPTNKKFFDHFNLIGIAPLLEKSIIDMSFKMIPSLKYDRVANKGKIPLRKIIANHDIARVSDAKIGFGMDLKALWKSVAKEMVTSNLDKARIFEDGLIKKEFYNRSLKRIDDTLDVRYISKLLHLLSLEIWYKMFVTFEISSKSSL